MNEHEQLKLQSYLDDELSNEERRQVARWLDDDSAARVLLAELRTTREVIRGHEPDYKLDCTREFFWNGIQRELDREEQESASAPQGGILEWIRGHAAQLGAVSAGAAVIAFSILGVTNEPEVDSAWEVLDPDTAMVNYNDFDNNITVVMLYDQSTAGFTSGD